jgi:galactose oxidase-like protein/glyoxal oxidase-like protein
VSDAAPPDPGSLIPDSTLFGLWEKPFEEGVVGVHAALLHTGEVLFWTYRDEVAAHTHADAAHANVPHGEWSLLQLSTGKQVVNRQISERNQFCSGQCLLGDGNLLVIGGERDTPVNDMTVSVFEPKARTWTLRKDLPVGRWYPTVVSVAATRGLAVGGDERTAGMPMHPNWTAQYVYEKGGWDVAHEFDADLQTLGTASYPFVFVLPDARLFVHLGFKTRVLKLILNALDFGSSLKLKPVDPTVRTYGLQGTAVLLPLRPSDNPPYRARILMIGGGNGAGQPAKKTCEILDFGDAGLKWKSASPMKNSRMMPDAVLLPDGKVLVVNGTATGDIGGTDPVFEAESYDPGAGTWTRLASMTVERLYHSTALLLPDARVLTAGTDREWNQPGHDYAHTQIEVFSPPYLFRGPRPAIRIAPESASYNDSFEVATDEAETIGSAVLIRNGSCTHSFNSDQRFVELKIEKRLAPRLWFQWTKKELSFGGVSYTITWPIPRILFSGGLRLKAPPNGLVAPEGYYMLFLLSNGVPSEARFIRVG